MIISRSVYRGASPAFRNVDDDDEEVLLCGHPS